MEDLLQQVAELQETVIRLQNIWETEKELDSCFQVLSAVDPQPMAKQPKAPGCSNLAINSFRDGTSTAYMGNLFQ